MKSKMKLFAPLVILAVILCGAYYDDIYKSYVNFRCYTLTVEGPGTYTGASIFNGTMSIDGNMTLTKELLYDSSAATLTSPALTISATDMLYGVLTSDQNTTGVTLTNGTTGQLVTLVTGAGSHTIRFDDNAATLSLGANITLTEGHQDSLTLLCTGDRTWAAIAAHDN